MQSTEVIEYLKEIESESYTYKQLLTYDFLFEIKGQCPDDNNLIDTIYNLNSHDGWCKLRGRYDEAKPRLADRTNDHDFCHGYIVFVTTDQVKDFEEELLVQALIGNIHIKKIPIGVIQEDINRRQEELFNSLFELA